MEQIPADVRELLRQHIHSVEQLEVLLFLRSRSERAWGEEAIAQVLRTSAASVARRLLDLERRGLACTTAADGAVLHRYAPRTPKLEEAVAQLAALYVSHRVAIIDLMFPGPQDAMRAFSNAFRFKKD